MDEYTLVQKQHLTDIADALRTVAELGEITLTFPEDFISVIQSLSPTIPTTESLTLSFVTGEDVYDADSNLHDGYVAVGHSSNYIKDDAVWSFTPSINSSSATFSFSWDNYTTSGANTGWATAMDYAFVVTTDGSSGLKAATASNKNVVSIGGSGTSGTTTINFTGLNLVAGTTYYIRANYNDATTKETLKAFAKDGNTVQLTA